MPSLYVFDIDGTVVDSVVPHQRSFLAALESFDLGRIDTAWDSYKHHTDSWIFRENFVRHKGCEPTANDLLKLDLSIAAFLEEISPYFVFSVTDGFHNFVERVVAAGDTVVFATGSMRRAAQAKLELAGVKVDASLITASEHFERERIVAAAVQEGARCAGISSFNRVICFGDGRWDLAAAESLGYDLSALQRSRPSSRGWLAPSGFMIHSIRWRCP